MPKTSNGKKENIGNLVFAMIKDTVEAAGYDIWDVDYHKEGAENDLEVIIENRDRTKRIGLDDCEKVSRLISPMLDEKDPIPENYYLEVSSAGLERVLRRPEHFEFCLDWNVTVYLYAKKLGTKKLCGKLKSFYNGNIVIENDSHNIEITKEEYSRVVAEETI